MNTILVIKKGQGTYAFSWNENCVPFEKVYYTFMRLSVIAHEIGGEFVIGGDGYFHTEAGDKAVKKFLTEQFREKTWRFCF